LAKINQFFIFSHPLDFLSKMLYTIYSLLFLFLFNSQTWRKIMNASEITPTQTAFGSSIAKGDEKAVREILKKGSKDLLCVIGQGAAVAIRTNPDIFELLTDENSKYAILREYHGTKPKTGILIGKPATALQT
jgi:hypothetical protein